jgi:hypothetical protein
MRRRNNSRGRLNPLFPNGLVTSFHQRRGKSVTEDQTRRGSDSLTQGMSEDFLAGRAKREKRACREDADFLLHG